jgi:hypothetical protein
VPFSAAVVKCTLQECISAIYRIPIFYLPITDICLSVRSEGVKKWMFPMEKVPDLTVPSDIEPAATDKSNNVIPKLP